MTYNVFSGMLNPTQSINQSFGHNTPMLQTGQDRQDRTDRQTDNSPIAQGEPSCKQPPKN